MVGLPDRHIPTLKAPHPVTAGIASCLEVDKMDKEANAFHWCNVIDPLNLQSAVQLRIEDVIRYKL
jgi:hypothetical protein